MDKDDIQRDIDSLIREVHGMSEEDTNEYEDDDDEEVTLEEVLSNVNNNTSLDLTEDDSFVVTFEPMDSDQKYASKIMNVSDVEGYTYIHVLLFCDTSNMSIFFPMDDAIKILPPTVHECGVFTIMKLSDDDEWVAEFMSLAANNGLVDQVNNNRIYHYMNKGMSPEEAFEDFKKKKNR